MRYLHPFNLHKANFNISRIVQFLRFGTTVGNGLEVFARLVAWWQNAAKACIDKCLDSLLRWHVGVKICHNK